MPKLVGPNLTNRSTSMLLVMLRSKDLEKDRAEEFCFKSWVLDMVKILVCTKLVDNHLTYGLILVVTILKTHIDHWFES